MATKGWSFSPSNASDATFRAWGTDLNTSFAAVGLVQTADTGQINWTTVTKPAVGNTYAGYEIWRFSDSSIYMKWEYGTGSSTALNIGIRLTIGTGSNGSGTLTGTVSQSRILVANTSGGSSLYSWMCCTTAFFGLRLWDSSSVADSGVSSAALVFICRSVDANTVPTNQSAIFYANTSSSTLTVESLNFQTSTSFGTITDSSFCYIPFSLSSSLVGTQSQFFTHWYATPQVVPVFPVVTVIQSEIGPNITFQANPVGSTLRTFMALPRAGTGTWSAAVNGTAGNYRFAMLWE